jgi:hypothetical protein
MSTSIYREPEVFDWKLVMEKSLKLGFHQHRLDSSGLASVVLSYVPTSFLPESHSATKLYSSRSHVVRDSVLLGKAIPSFESCQKDETNSVVADWH